MRKTLYVRFRNSLHPSHFSECSRCGGNWGWKKHADHMVSKSSGLFLFCKECDAIVTLEERWKALDEWKAECIRQQFVYNRRASLKEIMEHIADIENTEFIEFPRPE